MLLLIHQILMVDFHFFFLLLLVLGKRIIKAIYLVFFIYKGDDNLREINLVLH